MESIAWDSPNKRRERVRVVFCRNRLAVALLVYRSHALHDGGSHVVSARFDVHFIGTRHRWNNALKETVVADGCLTARFALCDMLVQFAELRGRKLA